MTLTSNAIHFLLLMSVAASKTVESEGNVTRPHIFMMLVDDWGSYDASYRVRFDRQINPNYVTQKNNR